MGVRHPIEVGGLGVRDPIKGGGLGVQDPIKVGGLVYCVRSHQRRGECVRFHRRRKAGCVRPHWRRAGSGGVIRGRTGCGSVVVSSRRSLASSSSLCCKR